MDEPTLPDKEKKELSSNINAIYVYLDTFLDKMTEEEISGWTKVLRELDPNFEKLEDE
jgi:hypothetical protein